MNEDYKKLYDAVSSRFDIGDYESFQSKMQTPEDRKRFYNVVSERGFDLGDYESYESRLSVGGGSVGKPQETSGKDLQTPAQPSTESGEGVEQVNFDTLPTFDVNRDERLSQAPKIEDLKQREDYGVRKEIFSYTPEKLEEANKEIDNEINSLKEQFEFIREQDNELNEYAKRINQSILPIQGAGSEQVRERIRKQILDYETRFSNLTEQDKAAKNKYNELIQRKSVLQEKTALDEFNKKAEQGNWFGGLYNSLLYGVGEMSAGITNDAIDIMVELMPDEMYGGLTKDEAKKQVKENLLPYVRKGTKELVGTEGTTDEYMQRVSEKNIFTEGIYGLARSAPAMVSPYMSGMYFQVKDGIRQEMELTPELNELNEWEKQSVQTPIALAGMFLERFGFSKLAKSTKAATIVTKEALSSLPQNATKKQIVDAISTTAQKAGAKLASGFAAEAETGALQEVSDVGIKEIYNQIKGKDLFSTPETVKEFETNVFRAGLAEGIGGFGMTIPTAASTFMAKGNLGKVTNNEQYELVEQIMSDPDALNAKKEQLKAQLESGKLTEEQYNTEINNIDAASQIISEIDETLPTEKRREAFDLITEKKKIQGELAELETKDPDLVAGKIEEKTKQLEDIGVKLQELALKKPQESKDITLQEEQKGQGITEQKETEQKQQDNATQEQTASQVPVQPETETSEKVEEGKPQTEFEVATQEVEEVTEKIAPKVQTSPKNLRGLVDTMKSIFSLDKPKAEAAAVVGDKLVDTMSKRAGISKDEMYQRLAFAKAQMKDLPQGVKFQVDAWHGSPYQFDKFTTEAIGTGEGAQAFGWGLYFTDLESIARNYADKLSVQDASTEFLFNKEGEEFLRYDLTTNKDFKSKDEILESYLNELSWRKDFYETDAEYKAEIDNALDIWGERNSEVVEFKKTRNLYKVSLHKGKTPDQYTWLEWDKRISESNQKKINSQYEKEGLPKTVSSSSNETMRLLGKKSDFKTYRPSPTVIYGEDFYTDLVRYFLDSNIKNPQKEASLFLLRAGIDGIKYPAESISRGATSDTARGFNYVVFDENAVSIEEVIKFQKDAQKARGAMMMTMDNQAIIYALTDPNVSTPLHELAHIYEHYLTDAERKAILDWAGHKKWTTETSEKFARGFEKYLSEGKAPTPALQKYFDNFKNWLLEIYNGIVGSDIDVKLNADMRKIYDMMLTDTKKGNKQKQDTYAIQKQAANESVLRQEQPEVGLQEVVEGDQKQEVVTEEGKAQKEEISVGDTVNATVEVYENGKKKPKRFKVQVTAINEDGTYDLKRGKLIYKNIKPEKIAKIKPPRARNITQETQGLTEKEQTKQGVEELVTSLKEKSREKLNNVTNKFRSIVNEQRKKLKDFKDRKATIISFSKDLLKGLSKSGVKYIPTSKIQGIINSIDQAKTDESLYNAAQKLIEQVNKIAVTDDEIKRRKKVVAAKNKVKKIAKRAGFGKFSQMIQNAFRLDEDAMSDSEIKEIEDLMIKLSDGDFDNISEIASRIAELSDKYTNESIIKEEKVETASDKAKKAKEKTSAIAGIVGKKAEVPKGVSVTSEEKSIIDTINSITREELDNMTLDELKALSKIIDRINQGVVEKDSQKFKERVLKRREAKKLEKSFDRVSLDNLFKRFIIAPMKAFWGKNITAIDSSFSGHIDSFFGLKGNEISKFLNNFEKKYSDYQFEMKEARAFLNKLYGGISRFRQKRRIADTKIMMYAIQKQFEENPNSNIVHSLKEFYEATIGSEALYNEYERQVGTDATKIVKDLYEKYSKGNITAENIWSDMSSQERKAYTSMRGKLESTVDRVVKIKSLDRGEVMQMINHYFSYPTLKEEELTGEQALEQAQNGYISTRAGVSKSRQSKVSKINFSASRSFLNAIDQVSKDFNLGEALRIELGALKELKDSFKNDPDKAAIVNEFVENVRERRSLLFESGFNETSRILNEIQAATYRYLLGTARRALVETATNLTRVVLRGAFMGQLGKNGLKNAMFVTKNSDKVNELIRTQGSDQKSRLLEGEEMAGYGDEFVSIGEDNYDLDFKDRNLDSRVAAGLRVLAKPTRKMGTAFIQAPDKFFSRMLFTLQFMRSFKNETGQDLDFSKLSDEAYNKKYRQALDNARFEADQEVSDWFSSTNRAQKPLNQLRAAKGGMLNRLKYFMISFMINEGQALQKAIINKGAKGAVQKGIPMFTGMAMYQALNEAALLGYTKLLSTLFGDDDEDYDVVEKVLEDKAIQRGLFGAYAELFILRHFNGVQRLPMNFILEAFNKRFGDKFGLREEGSEYDKYNSLVYNKIDLNGDIESVDIVGILAPELTPIASAVESGLKAYSIEPEKEKNKKKREAKEEKELYYTFKAYLTGAAAMGILPKDIRDSYVFYRNRELMFNGDKKKKKGTVQPLRITTN